AASAGCCAISISPTWAPSWRYRRKTSASSVVRASRSSVVPPERKRAAAPCSSSRSPDRRMERAFHLPQGAPERIRSAGFGGCTLATTELSAVQMRALLARLRASAPRSTAAERAATLARAARRFLDADDPLRRRAADALSALTGFSRPMIEDALPRVFTPLADPGALARAAGTAHPVVRLLGIVGAGNVLGVPLFKTALALAAGAACMVKPATGEPLLSVLFAQAL